MVYDRIVASSDTHTITGVTGTFSQTHETHDVVATYADGIVAETDAVTWCCLTCNGEVVAHIQDTAVQRDDTRDVEDDGARTVG